jgi:hypothetical protein
MCAERPSSHMAGTLDEEGGEDAGSCCPFPLPPRRIRVKGRLEAETTASRRVAVIGSSTGKRFLDPIMLRLHSCNPPNSLLSAASPPLL